MRKHTNRPLLLFLGNMFEISLGSLKGFHSLFPLNSENVGSDGILAKLQLSTLVLVGFTL